MLYDQLSNIGVQSTTDRKQNIVYPLILNILLLVFDKSIRRSVTAMDVFFSRTHVALYHKSITTEMGVFKVLATVLSGVDVLAVRRVLTVCVHYTFFVYVHEFSIPAPKLIKH